MIRRLLHRLAHALHIHGCVAEIDFTTKPHRYGARCATCGKVRWYD